MNRKAFSFVEMIIAITIIVLLAIIANTFIGKRLDVSRNTKVVSDISTINTSLLSYKEEEWTTLEPQWNKNYFSQSGTYVHDSSEAYGVYGQFTENVLAKKYLDLIPLDPRTNQYYSYWIKFDNWQYEIAWVVKEDDSYIARLVSTYDWLGGINSLIREYNWPRFIRDGAWNLPYNPEERLLVVRAVDKETNEYKIYKVDETIIVPANKELELYFSDGSVSILRWENWEDAVLKLEVMDFPKENNLVSNVRLFLNAWTIWTQATQLSPESGFEIWTQDTEAAVRWTVFRVTKNPNDTVVAVYAWSVEVKNVSNPLNAWEQVTCNPNCWDTSKVDSNEIPSFSEPDLSETPINVKKELPLYTNDDTKWESGDCYLEGMLVKNGTWTTAFNKDCETLTRECVDWKLSWSSEYAYVKCVEGEENVEDLICSASKPSWIWIDTNSFFAWEPIEDNQAWQNTNPDKACYFKCNIWYAWEDCNQCSESYDKINWEWECLEVTMYEYPYEDTIKIEKDSYVEISLNTTNIENKNTSQYILHGLNTDYKLYIVEMALREIINTNDSVINDNISGDSFIIWKDINNTDTFKVWNTYQYSLPLDTKSINHIKVFKK